MKVLCFGSLNIDYTYAVNHFVQPGETLACNSLSVFSGGKGLNQSIALAKAGADTWHAGAIGMDGQFLKAQLEEAGVHTDFVKTVETETTGHAIIQISPDGENCILIYPGTNGSITQEQIDEVLDCFEAGDLLVLQNEIGNIPYLIQKAKARGMKIAFTPAPMSRSVLEYPLQDLDYIFMNLTEARALTNTIDLIPAEAMMSELAFLFPDTAVIFTMGSKGSAYISREKIHFQKAYPVQALDTTAAGDTFAGFMLAGLCQGLSPEKAMDLAARASAISVTRPGASSSIPNREEAESFSV